MKENFAEKYQMPEPGEMVTITYVNEYTEEVRFRGADGEYIQVTFLGSSERNSNIHFDAFAKLAHLAERDVPE